MSQDFERHLAEALTDLDQGKDIDAVLTKYSEEADELAPLLETAVYARETLDHFEPPSVAGLAAGRRRMLEAAARKRATPTQSWWQSVLSALGLWLRTPARGLATAALLLALFVVASGATVVASAESLPGDPLYPVKRTAEQVRLTLTTDPATRAALQAQFNQERQAEAQTVAAMGRPAQLQFEGVLERRTNGTWVVDGIELKVAPEAVEGEPAVGSTVVVDVVSPGDGTLHAMHMAPHGGQHGPMMPEGRGPMRGPGGAVPSATPTTNQAAPRTKVAPTEQPAQRPGPAMPMMPTDIPSMDSRRRMEPGGRQDGSERQLPHGPMGPMMEQPTPSPQPPAVTPVPTQEPGPAPTQAPPTQEVTTETPVPQPTRHGPMMPHPTQMPGGGHPGGPGGHGGGRHGQ